MFKDDKELPAKNTGGLGKDSFLKLTDGQSVVAAFRGAPYDYLMKWENGRGIVSSEGSFRFRINLLVHENGALVMKAWEQGRTTYDELRELHKDYPLNKNLIKITRKGSGKNTSYSLLPVAAPKGTITDEMEKKFAAIALLDLKPLAPKEDAPPPSDDDAPKDMTGSDGDMPDQSWG